ncbi:adenylosuccinate lyase family protein [Tetragenococcus halophilus]|uniref:class-II fumarase/aspartase family protein n=1 Tax=Tetragenococcus halophilus TaxID=51669 RepID=UPI001F2B67D4|nr:adenylosuccinate lyase family protein [Tetragenococcus halophilus]MCF1684957.1 adenylosuccinate lyase family protein [Tetragenococcus halophilus]
MRALYDSKSKTLDDRGIKELLDSRSKYQSWLDVEAALAQAQGELEVIPMKAAEEIVQQAEVENLDFKKMDEIYQQVGHGFVPFLKVFVLACGEETGKYIHFGATTQNIQQTAQNLNAKKVHRKFFTFLKDILTNLSDLAENEADTVMAGRTHGKHAIPITYGYKVAVWISELLMSLQRMQEVEKRMFTTMMGGAVGAFNSTGEIGIKVQKRVAELLDMPEMDIPSRNISSQKIEYINCLALVANNLHKIAEEVFQTSIEEFAEVSEGFSKGTVGSSTMPHKINPKLAKGIIANAQKLYSLTSAGYASSARPFEADSTSNMLFDGIITEALELMTEILMRAEELTRTLTVNRKHMLQNANINQGIDNSESIMMYFAKRIGKDKAHELIYELAIEAETTGENYRDVLLKNQVVRKSFTEEELLEMLKPENYTGLSAELAHDMAKKCKKIIAELP